MRPERNLRRFLIHLAGQHISPGSSQLCLADEEVAHLRTVLRLRAGDHIEVLDLDSNKVFEAEILSETTGEIRILSHIASGHRSNTTLFVKHQTLSNKLIFLLTFLIFIFSHTKTYLFIIANKYRIM